MTYINKLHSQLNGKNLYNTFPLTFDQLVKPHKTFLFFFNQLIKIIKTHSSVYTSGPFLISALIVRLIPVFPTQHFRFPSSLYHAYMITT